MAETIQPPQQPKNNAHADAALVKEMKFLGRLFIVYLVVVLFLDIIAKMQQLSEYRNTMMTPFIITFALPVLTSLIYIVRLIISLFQRKWERAAAHLFIIFLGCIIGAGVCINNLTFLN